MKTLIRITAVAALMLLGPMAHADTITVSLEDVTNGGGFFGEITFVDGDVGTVTVTADISAPINAGLTQGDILGLWFDIADEDVLDEMTFLTVIEAFVSANGVSASLDPNVSLNGTGQDNWDIGLIVGENGERGGFNQVVTFDITSVGLTASMFADMRVGMRVQSIEGALNFTGGSSKLIGPGNGGPGNGHSVPEPGTIALLGLGLLGMGATRRRKVA